MSHNTSESGHCCSACAELDNHHHNHKHHEESEKLNNIKQILLYSFGAALFVIGLTLDRLEIPNCQYLYILSYLIFGYDVIIDAVKNLFKGSVLDENFLMSAASAGALIIGEFPEAAAVMIFFKVGEYFEHSAVRRSKKSIADLMDIRPDYANLLSGNQITRVDPETIREGDFIVVKPGEKIPLDGIISEGDATLDTTALTGEAKPRDVKAGDSVLSGCINKTGAITIKVTKIFSESTVSKIINMVENVSSKKAKTENFITTFSKYYTPCVVALAVLIGIIPPFFIGGSFAGWINRGLIFLVISCPCALVISIPLSFFSGIGLASKNGILIKGSNYLEALNNLKTVVFDKTGTLTKGEFSVSEIYPEEGYKKEELLEICAKAEYYSNHPIALSILRAYGREIDGREISEYRELAGQGISARVGDKKVFLGNEKPNEGFDTGGTNIFVRINEEYAGYIVISDEIKQDSYDLVNKLEKRGVKNCVMLTGDNREIAKSVAEKLGIKEYYAELLPNEKVQKTEEFLTNNLVGKTAFIGDGINDAPVLARADIGVAMGGLGSDASIEAADIVIMTDEPSKLAAAIDIAKITKKIVWQNIIFILGVKGLFLVLGAFGAATMWAAVFADVGVSVVAILNSMRIKRLYR